MRQRVLISIIFQPGTRMGLTRGCRVTTTQGTMRTRLLRMRERSLNSVRVVFADEKAVLLGLRRYAGQLRASRPEVEKVGYFGSYAAGTYGPASDVDLLI